MSKTIIIDEDISQQIDDLLTMTQFKFKANIRKFLAALLEDPTGAEPDVLFTHNGLDKNKLIKALVDNKVITKKMTIDDHDENGNPHTAKMIVRYSVPKERFNERLDALYDVLFPNVDAKINESLFETDPYEDSLKIIKNSPLTMGVVSGGVNCKLSPEYGMGKFFDDAAKALNKKIEDKKLDEEGGGATSCSGVDGNGFGSGEFTVPAFGKVIKRKKKKVGGNPYTLGEKVIRISESQARMINESAVDRFIDKMIFNRLPEQLKQYVNTPVNDLLKQRPDLVSAQSLGATEAELAQFGGYPLKDFIRLSISKMFDIGHGKGPKKYLKGIFRIVLDELNYLQHPDQNAIQNLKNDVMYVMQASENGSDPDAMKLDSNLNGLNAGQLHNMFKDKRKAFAKGLRDRVSSMFKGGKSDYRVVPILTHEDAVKFQPYTSWCITYDSSSNYDQYVQGGRRFYIFLENGFERIPQNVGENCPMDNYGLSMISILVDTEGNIDYITTRWNHDHDGEYHNPDAETVRAFQNVIGMNLYDVCKPYTREELHAMGIIPFDEVPELLVQGVPLKEIFDSIGDFYNGLAYVVLNDKWNWVRQDNGQLFSDQWFDWTGGFRNGFARVKLNGKMNWIRADNGQLVSDQWFDGTGDFENGFAGVVLNDKYNWVRADNGQFFGDQWFDYVGNFRNGVARVKLNGKENWIRVDNGQFFSKQWFDWVDDFNNRFAAVQLNGKYNRVRADNGQLLYGQWFDWFGAFENGLSGVRLNDKYNWLREDNGQLLCGQWFDRAGNFENGFAWVELNGKRNWIDTQGKLYDYDPRQRMVSESLVEKIVKRIISEAVTGKDAEKAAAIYAYCLDDKEEDYCILCAKRLEGDEKGKWNPPMGHLHVGESPKDGAVRECEEESGVKIPKSKLQVGSYEDWGRNYWVILDGTVKDWPVGEGDGENSKFEWKNVYGLFWGEDKDLEWAWNTKDFVYKFAPAELDLDESVHHKVKILNEGYWGHLPLENDSALDEFGEIAYNNIEEQLKNIDKNWGDKTSVFTYLGVIMYMLQIYNFFYSLKSLDKKFDFTNKINKAIKYIDDEKFINEWDDPEEVKEYIKKLPDTIKEILDKNSLGSDNFKKLKVTVPCNEGKNYVNMNVDVRKGGRSAVKMSVDDFKQEMIHAYHQYAMEQEHKYKSELQLTPSPGNFVYSLAYGNKNNKKSKYASALYDDIWDGKYKFDSENVDAYGGIKMSKKGFPYIQCAAGGDWECPVCFFVYFDGNKFRGYVPLKGNALNRNEKHAFSGGGNEPDAKFVQKELGLSYEEADHMCDDIDYNVDACLEDFLSRVDVKGTYKKRDFTKDEEEFKKYRKEKIDAENKRQEEAERIRQMNAQKEEGIQNPEGSEELKFRTLGPEDEITEATATGTGGLPGEFTVPFPMDKEDPSLDRTPGDTMGMHDRVGKSNLEEKRKKVVKNDEGEVVPEFCKKCGGKIGTYVCGEPIYKCSECGEYYGTVPFTLGRKKSIKESKQTWRDNPLFTIGKFKGIEKAKVINENPDYCLWLHKKVMDEINNTPFSPKELALLDVSYYRKYKKFPIRSPHTPKYAKINGKYVCDMDKDELQYVWEHGSKEFKWLVKQEHNNRGWERRNWGAPAFQTDDVGDEAWMNR